MLDFFHKKAVPFSMSAGIYCIFFVKSCLNTMISSLLGFIVATGVILDITPMRKAYIVISLGIILALAIDRKVRESSKTLDMLATIFGPINLDRGMRKVISYSRKGNCMLTCSLGFIEIYKICSAVFCIITLSVEEILNTWIIYWLLGTLLLESMLGLLLYIYFTVCIILYENFYMKVLENMAGWYLHDSVKYEIYKAGTCIFLKMSPLDDY